MKVNNCFYRVVCEGGERKLKSIYKIIAIDIYGRILMEDISKPCKEIMIWDAKDVLDKDNFEKV